MRFHQRLAAVSLAIATGATLAAGITKSVDPTDRPALRLREPTNAATMAAAMAGPHIVAVGERGLVIRSEDGGKTWNQREVPVSVSLTAVRFSDAMFGVAVGHGGIVLITRDAGERWTKVLDGRQAARLVLESAQARVHAAPQDSAAQQALTEARRLVADGPDKPFFDVHFFDREQGLVIGAYNLALQTRDGGRSWQNLANRWDNPEGLHLHALRVQGERLLIVGERGLALFSEDRGATFRRLHLPYEGSLFTAEFGGADSMVVAGLRGHAFQSADAGRTWTRLPLQAAASFTASARTVDGTLLLANQAGQVLAQQAERWRPLTDKPLPPITALLPLPDGQLLALTVRGPRRLDMASGAALRGARP